MLTRWRWGVVAAGVGLLVALPPAIGALPARDAGGSAADLLERVQRSATVGYSGYAEAVGGLGLPLTRDLAAVADLFGDRTRLRVWWRGEQDWRVDTLTATGETGLYRDLDGLWTWSYERGLSVRTSEPPVRLPRGSDLDPGGLGRRLLSRARLAEVSRLPARRVAGRDALGLRLRPGDPGSTVDRVDVWVDPSSGVPLRVVVYGAGSTRPVVDTWYLDFDARPPASSILAFDPPYPERIRLEVTPDLAATIDTFSTVVPPAELAGLPLRRRVEGLGSVGTYGTGVTVLVAVPLPSGLAWSLADQLAKAPGAKRTGTPGGGGTIRLAVGPLSVLLTDPADQQTWLFTGTVTGATLDRAAVEIAAHPPERHP